MHSNGGKVSTGMRASCKDSTMWPLYNELVFAVFAETDKPLDSIFLYNEVIRSNPLKQEGMDDGGG